MIGKYYNTLKYLKLEQTAGRFLSILRKKLFKTNLPEIPGELSARINPKAEFLFHDPWNTAEKIKAGIFKFLNNEQDCGFPPDWKSKEIPLLWEFNLHYFNYGYLLDTDDFESICLDWIKNNPVGIGTGWHAYPLSLRIVNWIKLNPANENIIKSIYRQASYLYRNLEFYFPGNHYLENAKALFFAAVYFNGIGESQKWMDKSISIFNKELPVQVLNDGGYFERSTMYHSIMLHGFLDMFNICDEKRDISGQLKEIIEKMIQFQVSATHPDGSIALFNDSTVEIAPQTGALLEYASGLGITVPENKNLFPSTGYYIFRDSEIYLMVDGGPIGPDYLPAHAHADIFSYELSAFGEKIITDSGVFEYKSGDNRKYCRSTSAHNTVAIDGVDQAECWDSFRVARRFNPINVKCESTANHFNFSGEFDGYSKLIGNSIKHIRRIEFSDKILSVTDTISGKGKHTVSDFIHFSPNCEIIKSDDLNYKLVVNGKELRIQFESIVPKIIETEYFPEFGKRIKRKCLLITKLADLPLKINYKIFIK